jgi:hypothetical protein
MTPKNATSYSQCLGRFPKLQLYASAWPQLPIRLDERSIRRHIYDMRGPPRTETSAVHPRETKPGDPGGRTPFSRHRARHFRAPKSNRKTLVRPVTPSTRTAN